MSGEKGLEIEVKFYLPGFQAFISKLEKTSAELISPRTHEYNLRFDTPNKELTKSGQVLRLRQDAQIRLTYKGAGKAISGTSARQEIEFTVGDYDAAKGFMEVLGYQVSQVYEKYRTTYVLDGLEVVLDELPYGNFVEIEGEDPESIHTAASKLGLAWERRILISYLDIFEKVKQNMQLEIKDLTFENFEGVEIKRELLSINPNKI